MIESTAGHDEKEEGGQRPTERKGKKRPESQENGTPRVEHDERTKKLKTRGRVGRSAREILIGLYICDILKAIIDFVDL